MVSLIPRQRGASKDRDQTTASHQPRKSAATKGKAPRPSDKHDNKTVPSTKTASRTQLSERDRDSPVRVHRHLLPTYKHQQLTFPYSADPTGDHLDRPRVTAQPTSNNVLRRKRSLIEDHVNKSRESPPETGPGSLAIQIPRQVPAVRPTQSYGPDHRAAIASPTISRTPSIRPNDISIDSRNVFQAPTPLSEVSATPSLRNYSPSVFSQVSPSSTATPTLSLIHI